MSLLTMAGRRLLASIPTLLLIVIGVFLLLQVAPGDTVDALMAQMGGGDPAMVEQMRRFYGLDQPVGVQLMNYLRRLASLDLGYSYVYAKPVLDVILERLPATLLLMVSSLAFAFFFGLVLGVIAARQVNRWPDTLISTFGLIFYALVLIAAISSAISLIEAVSVTFIDHASAKGHERDRNKVLAVVCLAITLLACLVAVDGLGSNGIAPKDLFHINSKADWCADWLDFMDMISEGIAMPLGAMLMSIMVGWEIKPKSLYGEIDSGYNGHIHGFYTFCIKYLCPVIMFFILLVQISTFFGLGWFN